MDDDRGHCLAPVAAASDVMKQMRLAIALSIGLAAAGCAGTTPVAPDTVTSISQGNLPAPAQSRPDFSGLWSIDADASDDPQKKLKEAMKAMKQAGGGGHGKQGNSGGRDVVAETAVDARGTDQPVAWVGAARCRPGNYQRC